MKNSILLRLEEEYAKCKDHLRHPSELMARPLADEDFVDAAVVGGVSIEGILAGKIHEDAVPADVKHAFHLQYPRLHEGFVGAVQRLSPHSNKLRGLVNGVRGKLFEINYVDYLNHGHLPAGLVARLATSATNTAWDVSITDHSGHVNQVLQLKEPLRRHAG